MTERQLCKKIKTIISKIKELEESKRELAWIEGVPAIINKMKKFNRSCLPLREMEVEGYFCPEDLWFDFRDGRYAAKMLQLDDDKLFVVYNTIINHEESYKRWEYGEDDKETEVNEMIAKSLISQILPMLLVDDCINYASEDDIEVDVEATSAKTLLDIKNKLIITRVPHPLGECLSLNMPVKELFDALSPDDDNFHKNLTAAGIEFDAPVMASPQDVEDYQALEKSMPEWGDKTPVDKETERLRSIYNNLSGLMYEDKEFTDEKTGKKGLLDQFGNIVVPALFDSCRGATDMTEINNYAVVEKNGKFFRTPRDGSGRLIDDEGYDKFYANGDVIRQGKYGKVSIKSPQVLIPCLMDWLAYDNFYEILFCKDGKLGMRDTYLHKYVPPMYSAYDITTLRFCRDGVWGWVSRETGEFFTEPIGNRYDVMIACCDANSYLNYADKPKVEREEQYISLEDARKQLDLRASEFKKTLKYKLSSLLELPPLIFKRGYELSERLYYAIRALSMDRIVIVSPIGDSDAPEMHITHFKKERRNIYRLEWSPKSNALAWHDASLKELSAFHQLIIPEKDTFSMRFYRDFTMSEIPQMTRFIAYYYATVWALSRWSVKLVQQIITNDNVVLIPKEF